jgi:ABC-type oligopeptide transport system substrate-binding subunit
MEINRVDLRKLGIEIEPRQFAGFDIFDAMDTRGSDFAIGQGGWCKDYPDPYDYINVLLSGDSIQADNNTNYSYFDNEAYNRRMRRAAKMIGAARYNAYSKIERDIFRNQSPLAAWRVVNFRMLFSNRVDMRSFVYQPVYETPIFNVLALK